MLNLTTMKVSALPVPGERVASAGKLPGKNDGPFEAFGDAGAGKAPEMKVEKAKSRPPAVPSASEIPKERRSAPGDFKPEREVVEERARHQEVWINTDGSRTTKIHGDPINFQRDGRWLKIDTTLVADPERDGWYTTKANDWTASFGPIEADGTGGVAIASTDDTLLFAPMDPGRVIKPEVSNAGEHPVVIYRDAWPGVDLRYTVGTGQVKEDLVVREPGQASFAFEVRGSRLHEDGETGEFATAATGDRAMRVLAPTVTAKDGKSADVQARPSATVIDVPLDPKTASNDVVSDPTVTPGVSHIQAMTVEVDQRWLESLTSDQLPIVIDPTTVVGPSFVYAYKQGVGSPVTDGWARVGDPDDVASGYPTWRTAMQFPYDRPGVSHAVRRIEHATLSMSPESGSPMGLPDVSLYWANAMSWAGMAPGFGLVDEGTWDGSAYQFDVSDMLQYWISQNHFGGVFGAADPAPAHAYYKRFTNLILAFVENAQPSLPTLHSPDSGTRVVTDANPTLRINQVNSDPDGDVLKWNIRIATGPDASSGTIAESGWQTFGNNTWQVPEGTLRDGQTYYWSGWVTDGKYEGERRAAGVHALIVDRRLSTVDAAPNDTLGPFEANLVTGNVSLTVESPTVQTVGGEVGVSMTHNSIADRQGLEGSYFVDRSGPANSAPDQTFNSYDQMVLRRIDSQINFSWDVTSPTPALPSDNFLVRWEGFIALGDDPGGGADQWVLGQVSDDGIRVYINNTLVLNDWTTSPAGAPVYNDSFVLSSGVTPPKIRVDYFEQTGQARVELWAKRVSDGKQVRVPSSWFSYEPRVLPVGWSFNPGSQDSSYTNVRVNDGGMTLYRPDGSTLQYKLVNGAYVPPEGEHDVASVNSDGTVTINSADGFVYLFGTDGRLQRVLSGADDLVPAAPTQSYWSSGRISHITDPVSNRSVTLHYYGGEGTCPAIPAWIQGQVASGPGGTAAGPAGMLCKVQTWDGKAMELFYNSTSPDGALTWVVNPGEQFTGFSYDGTKITYLIDPLNSDLIRLNAAPASLTRMYEAAYTGNRVQGIVAPEPWFGSARPYHSYGIVHAVPPAGQLFTGGVTLVGVAGVPGVARTVTYDGQGRLIQDTDALNRTTYTWYKGMTDLVASVQHPGGAKVNTIYDHADRPIKVTNRYTGSLPPSISGIVTNYDEGMTSLLATWWDNENLVGSPKRQTIGIGGPGGAINVNWGTSNPPEVGTDKFSLRLTGEVQIPIAGNYHFGATADDHVAIYIDDQLHHIGATPGATQGGADAINLTAGRHKIRVDFRELGGPGRLELLWRLAGGGWNIIPGSSLFPRLGLATSEVDPDGLKVETRYQNGTHNAAHGLATHIIKDPAGIALAELATFEAPGSGFLRRMSRTLPGGNTTTYQYYGATQAVANPCTGGAAVNQGGLLWRVTDPDPDAAGPQAAMKRETVYDTGGRPVAIATFTSANPSASDWTCLTYDARGRVTSTTYPAYGGSPARTETTDYMWNGIPSATLITDSTGSIGTMVDMLGRPGYHWDVYGVQSSVAYDQAGRLTSTVNAATGTIGRSYDAGSQLTSMTFNGLTLANGFTYDPEGRLLTVTYPSGSGGTGNGSTGTFTYDTQGNESSVTWKSPGGTVITSDVVVRTNAGRVWDQTVDGVSPSASNEYTYDAAGRLYVGTVAGRSQGFAFATASCGANINAGKNSNRTALAQSDNGGPIVYTTYCYDHADRLTSSSDPAVGTVAYDSHGNTTGIFGEIRTYDAANRHLSTVKGGTTVTYSRDATDRIVRRAVNGVVTARYSFSGLGDSPSATLTSSNVLIEANLSLPGGAMVATRSSGNVWSYPNLHGDVVAAANQAGTKQGSTVTFDAFGNRVGAVPAVDNSVGAFDYGWLGRHQRPLETEASLQPVIEMGARQYSPLLGRFLQVDPIEGGSANDYDYANADPVNQIDLSGEKPCKKGQSRDRSGSCLSKSKAKAKSKRQQAIDKKCGTSLASRGCQAAMKKCGKYPCYKASKFLKEIVPRVYGFAMGSIATAGCVAVTAPLTAGGSTIGCVVLGAVVGEIHETGMQRAMR